MSKFIEDYLKGTGTDSKTISALMKTIEDKDATVETDPLIEAFKANQKKLMENDSEIVSAIAAKEKGKILDIVTRKIKSSFGLDSASIKDKEIEEVIAIAKAESQKGLSKDLQTVQQENADLAAKVKDYEDVQIPKIKSEVEAEKRDFKVSMKIQKQIPIADLRVPVETVDMVLNSQLMGQFDLDLDDKGEILIFNKGTKLQAKSADGTKLLTSEAAIAEILKKNKFIKESNADDIDPATGKKKEISIDLTEQKKKTEQVKKVLPHIEAAQAHAAKLKEDAAKAVK